MLLHEKNSYLKIDGLRMVIKGSFEYLSGKRIYSDESFWVYKNFRDHTVTYQAENLTRMDSGEFMKVIVTYKVGKDLYPLQVDIHKSVGSKFIEESFKITKKNVLSYFYKQDSFIKRETINTPPRFHVLTPCISTSFIFVSSKKYDPTGRNYHNFISSDNFFDYKETPTQTYVVLERMSSIPIDLKIKGKEIKALHYRLYSNENYEKNHEIPVDIYMSKFMSIPYLIDGKEEMKSQIKTLHELDVDLPTLEKDNLSDDGTSSSINTPLNT